MWDCRSFFPVGVDLSAEEGDKTVKISKEKRQQGCGESDVHGRQYKVAVRGKEEKIKIFFPERETGATRVLQGLGYFTRMCVCLPLENTPYFLSRGL